MARFRLTHLLACLLARKHARTQACNVAGILPKAHTRRWFDSCDSGNYTALDFHRANASHFEPLTNFDSQYSTVVFAEEIQRIIRASAQTPPEAGRRPFFVYAPFEAVHGASSCYVEGEAPNCQKPDGDELQVRVSDGCLSVSACVLV